MNNLSLSLSLPLSLSLSWSDSEMLRYAYAELEESRGAIQVLWLQLFLYIMNYSALNAQLSCFGAGYFAVSVFFFYCSAFCRLQRKYMRTFWEMVLTQQHLLIYRYLFSFGSLVNMVLQSIYILCLTQGSEVFSCKSFLLSMLDSPAPYLWLY